MSKAVGKFKNLKELGKKISTKLGAFFKKTGKVMEKIKPVVDIITDVVPHGDKIDMVYNAVQKGVDFGGKVTDTINGLTDSESRVESKPVPINRPRGFVEVGSHKPSGSYNFGSWQKGSTNSNDTNNSNQSSNKSKKSFLENKLN